MATYRNDTGVKVTRDNLEQVRDNLQLLSRLEVLVGFPEDSTARDQDPEDDPENRGITNAALGYIHDQGSPEVNIPARPFMVPGMEDATPAVKRLLGAALRAGMRGNALQMEQAMIAAGLAAKLGIQNKINEGIPPPLAEMTLRKRARRAGKSSIAKAAQIELDRRRAVSDLGEDPFFDMETALTTAKPLIDTAQMRNAVNYVIRAKSKRRK